MPRSRLAVAFMCAVLMLVFAPHLAAQETQDTTALPEALRPLRAALGEAYAKLDGAAASAVFADDAVVEFGGSTYSGRAAVQGWFAETLAQLSSLKAGAATFVVTDGQVIERNEYTAVTSMGESTQGRSEVVWKRQADGSWKATRLTVL